MVQVKPLPEGMGTATPHLVCGGAAAAIAFYKRAFGAKHRVVAKSILTRRPLTSGTSKGPFDACRRS
jgi:hypothetical protein